MGIFSKVFGSKKKTKSESTQTATPTFLPQFSQLAGPISDAALRELNKTPDQLVAGLSDDEKAAFAALRTLSADPTYNARIQSAVSQVSGAGGYRDPGLVASQAALGDRSGLTDSADYSINSGPGISTNVGISTGPTSKAYGAERVGTNEITADSIQGRMSPFIQNVIDPAMERLDIEQGVDRARTRAARAGRKAFGWGGEKSELLENYLQDLTRRDTYSNLLQKGFESAQVLSLADEARMLDAMKANQQTSLGENQLAQGVDVAGMNIRSQEALEGARLRTQAETENARIRSAEAMRGAELNANTSAQNYDRWLNAMVSSGQIGANEAASIRSATIQGGQAAGQLADQGLAGNLSLIQGQAGAGATARDISQRTLQAPSTQVANAANILYGAPTGQTGTASGTTTTTATPSMFDIASGVVRAAATAGAFAGGGLVGDEEPPIPGMMSTFPPPSLVPGVPYDRASDTLRMQAALEPPPGYGEQEVLPPLRTPTRPTRNWVEAESLGGGGPMSRRGMVGGPVGMATSVMSLTGDEGYQVDGTIAGSPLIPAAAAAELPSYMTISDMGEVGAVGEPRALNENYGIMPARERPAIESASPRDLMANTIAALADTSKQPRKRFIDKVADFLNKDSTIESFAMFSPGWASLADRRAEARKIASAQAAMELEAETKAAELFLKQQELGLKYQGGAMFSGEGIEPQIYNLMLSYKEKKDAGIPTTPQEDAAYSLGYSKLTKPFYQTLPDGTQIMQPGMDVRAFPQPYPGAASPSTYPETGAALTGGPQDGGGQNILPPNATVIGQKPLALGQETMLNGLIDEARVAYPMVQEFATSPGTLETLAVNWNAPGGRGIRQAFTVLAANRLRFESQGQISKEESLQQAEKLLPSPIDSEDVRKQRLASLLTFWRSVFQNQRRPLGGEVGGSMPAERFNRATGQFEKVGQ